MSFRVTWDNGASACGTFSDKFDTYEDADAFGKDWADESNLRDFGTVDPDEGYTYDVVEVETVDEGDPDTYEGTEHMRMRDHEVPR